MGHIFNFYPTVLLLSLSFGIFQPHFSASKQNQPAQTFTSVSLSDTPKNEAFKVLQSRCNTCHRIQNPRRVFTLANMEDLAPKIHKQVFIKKRMPKGKNNTLSGSEKQALSNWLTTLNLAL